MYEKVSSYPFPFGTSAKRKLPSLALEAAVEKLLPGFFKIILTPASRCPDEFLITPFIVPARHRKDSSVKTRKTKNGFLVKLKFTMILFFRFEYICIMLFFKNKRIHLNNQLQNRRRKIRFVFQVHCWILAKPPLYPIVFND